MELNNIFEIKLNGFCSLNLLSEAKVPTLYDRIFVKFCMNNGESYELYNDLFETILIDIKSSFKLLIEGKLVLGKKPEGYDFGYNYNIYAYNLWKNDEDETIISSESVSMDYNVWLGTHYSFWIYAAFEKFYYVVTKTYPYLEKMQEMTDNGTSFKKWLDLEYSIVNKGLLEAELLLNAIKEIENLEDTLC